MIPTNSHILIQAIIVISEIYREMIHTYIYQLEYEPESNENY